MSRTFIFLFDGTATDPTEENVPEPSNVFKLNPLIFESRIFEKRQESQITFYTPGIGTKFFANGFFQNKSQIFFGSDIGSMVFRAYINLTSNYRDGDRIVAIGFSRGGIAARLFVRIISDFGLLRARYISFLSNKMELFFDAIQLNFIEYMTASRNYKADMVVQLHDCPKISFLGMFDCAGGQFDASTRNFLENIDQTLSKNVEQCLHIMSIHEIRSHFQLWRFSPNQEVGRELWMPGVHCDVGGGYLSKLLAQISLLTMANELTKSIGIKLDPESLKDLRANISSSLRDTIVINKEAGPIGEPGNRKSHVRQGDRVHFFHSWLIGESVFWKQEKHEIYQNKFGDMFETDMETAELMTPLLPEKD